MDRELPQPSQNDVWTGDVDTLQRYLQQTKIWDLLTQSQIQKVTVEPDALGRVIVGHGETGEVFLYEDRTKRPTLGQVAAAIYSRLEQVADLGHRIREGDTTTMAQKVQHGVRKILDRQESPSALEMLRTGIGGTGPSREDVEIIDFPFDRDRNNGHLNGILAGKNLNHSKMKLQEFTRKPGESWEHGRRRLQCELQGFLEACGAKPDDFVGVRGHSEIPNVLQLITCTPNPSLPATPRAGHRPARTPGHVETMTPMSPAVIRRIRKELMFESPYQDRVIIYFLPARPRERVIDFEETFDGPWDNEEGTDDITLSNVKAAMWSYVSQHQMYVWVTRETDALHFRLAHSEEEKEERHEY